MKKLNKDQYFYFHRELEQLQNEKRKQLLEHETSKLKACDETLQKELKEWKSQLLPRKQVRFFLKFISYY